MAKHRIRNSEQRIARLIAEGRGTGSGKNYVPWIKIHDFSSLGRVHRRMSAKSGREVHLLSDGEDDLFLQLDASPLVVDIREQFPLCRAVTIIIAEQLGYRHPAANGIDTVMTTDLVVTWVGGGLKAYAVKTASDLAKRSVQRKLEIERIYWTEKGVEWILFVSDEPNRNTRLNFQEPAEWRAVDDLVEGRAEWDRRAAIMMMVLLHTHEGRLADVCALTERKHGWDAGVGISACKRLMALGRLGCSGNSRFDPLKSVQQLEIKEEPTS